MSVSPKLCHNITLHCQGHFNKVLFFCAGFFIDGTTMFSFLFTSDIVFSERFFNYWHNIKKHSAKIKLPGELFIPAEEEIGNSLSIMMGKTGKQ